jgi:hypothetical protein
MTMNFSTHIFKALLATVLAATALSPSSAQQPIQVNGVFPKMTIASGYRDRSEAGIGALVPWANKLWAVGYVAHIKGTGLGLYEISDDMTMQRHPLSYTGTYANRHIHNPSHQAFIGPYAIDTLGKVRLIDDLKTHRLTATIDHLTQPDSMVYFLTMEGLFFETNVYSLKSRQLFDLTKELEIPKEVYIHFKGAFTQAGKVVVANNSYYEADYLGKQQGGRLGEWDGKKWTILDKNPYVEVAGKHWANPTNGDVIYATGWDRASVILKFYKNGVWKTYRLPKASYAYDHAWNTEWMRIREAQTERYLMDVHGIFYELPTITYDGNIMGIRPIANHLRLVPDFCFWRGMFVMAGDQNDRSNGQPQSGLWFGNIDELWQMGKPKGWGGPWYEASVQANQVSDPYLMTGFDKKVLHLKHDLAEEITFRVEVDVLGNNTWSTYQVIKVGPNGYEHHEFPDAFSAHWLRITPNKNCKKLSAFLIYN